MTERQLQAAGSELWLLPDLSEPLQQFNFHTPALIDLPSGPFKMLLVPSADGEQKSVIPTQKPDLYIKP